MEVIQNENEFIVKIPKEKKSTLEDLKQNLINKLNESVGQLDESDNEIELLKVILDYENHKPTDWQNSVYVSKIDLQSSKSNINKDGTINYEKN